MVKSVELNAVTGTGLLIHYSSCYPSLFLLRNCLKLSIRINLVWSVVMQIVRIEDIENYLGKPVYDPYGRRIGFIIGFYSDPDGNVYSFEVSFGDFEFREVSIDRFKLGGDGIILIPEWEHQALMIENRIERLRKRISALNELYNKKEIPLHAYESYKKSLENELLKARNDCKNVRDIIRKRMSDLDSIIVELEKTLANLRVNYLAKELSEVAYKEASDHIKKQLEIALREKESVKKHYEKLENLEKQPIDIGVRESKEQQVQNQPIPVVVLEA